ncbi:hypothetical protein CEP54_016411, partial [Fusarium duplospermum]
MPHTQNGAGDNTITATQDLVNAGQKNLTAMQIVRISAFYKSAPERDTEQPDARARFEHAVEDPAPASKLLTPQMAAQKIYHRKTRQKS